LQFLEARPLVSERREREGEKRAFIELINGCSGMHICPLGIFTIKQRNQISEGSLKIELEKKKKDR
jgi:hypothetical protein